MEVAHCVAKRSSFSFGECRLSTYNDDRQVGDAGLYVDFEGGVLCFITLVAF